MYKSPIVTFFQILSVIGSVLGIVFFFINPIVTIICGAFSLVSSIINIIWGDQNNLGTEIFTIVVATVIFFFTETNWFEIVTFALCIVEVLLTIIGRIAMAFSSRRF